ncbi:Zinc/iron permease [Microdochium trichocladiopsis]|uniref:Zinc/iron permease n=1 Tax=Microdochium trichocladiopsis TaxID=1682393 RepID=A0A9P8YFR2_9PEZI|nr:Zinc/iron permease [Microdochium trichocladiopsis]KAH7038092.1 Zinc/iron permease [Microdochium trichocladiopsis]
MTLSQSQLRLISSVGIGVLVGTALIVIIPEGIEAITSANMAAHTRNARDEAPTGSEHAHAEPEVPTFWVGLSLILGFILMFLIDRLPQIASQNFQPAPQPRQISLSNLGGSAADEEEAEGFLGSLTPSPKQSRSLATTTGLVIHAAADGIALGASTSSSDMKLGFIVFLALMIHKAPAAFGLTTLLLKQGLSKRAARGHLIVFSLSSPVGAWATYLLVTLLGGTGESPLSHWWTGMLLLFSGGTFLYVAMHAMQEGEVSASHHEQAANGYADSMGGAQQKQPSTQVRDTLATIGGMLLPLLTQFGHHEH